MRYHLTPTMMAIVILKKDNNKCWQRGGEIGTLIHCGGNEKWFSTYRKQFSSSLKSKTLCYYITKEFF